MSSMIEAVLGFGPSFSPIPNEVLEFLQKICLSPTFTSEILNVNPEIPTELPDLVWGCFYTEKVDRLAVLSYRLRVDETQSSSGFMITCESLNKDRFKLLVFDAQGNLIVQDDCVRSRNGKMTQSSLHFNSCTTYKLPEASIRDKDSPPLLSQLEDFKPSNLKVAPGHYLVAVFGDNLFGKSAYRLSAVPFAQSVTQENAITACDGQVLQLKEKIDALRVEFLAARRAYVAALEKIRVTGVELEATLDARDKAYRWLQDTSLHEYYSRKNLPSTDAAAAAPNNLTTVTVTPKRRAHYFTFTSKVSTTADAAMSTSSTAPVSLKPKTPGVTTGSTATSTTTDTPAAVTTFAPVTGAASSQSAAVSNSFLGGSMASVTNSANAAGGWLSKTFSNGLSQIQTIVTPKKESPRATTTRAPPAAAASNPSAVAPPAKPYQVHHSHNSASAAEAMAMNESKPSEETDHDLPDFHDEATRLFRQLSLERDALVGSTESREPFTTVVEKMKEEDDPNRRRELHDLYALPASGEGAESHTNYLGESGAGISTFDQEAANLLRSIATSSVNDEVKPSNSSEPTNMAPSGLSAALSAATDSPSDSAAASGAENVESDPFTTPLKGARGGKPGSAAVSNSGVPSTALLTSQGSAAHSYDHLSNSTFDTNFHSSFAASVYPSELSNSDVPAIVIMSRAMSSGADNEPDDDTNTELNQTSNQPFFPAVSPMLGTDYDPFASARRDEDENNDDGHAVDDKESERVTAALAALLSNESVAVESDDEGVNTSCDAIKVTTDAVNTSEANKSTMPSSATLGNKKKNNKKNKK